MTHPALRVEHSVLWAFTSTKSKFPQLFLHTGL